MQINENNRKGKTRNLLNQRYQGDISCKDGHDNRNDKDLREAEEIKKRQQEYTEALYKKDLYDPDNHDDVITHLEPDIWNVKSGGPQEALP